MVTIARLRDLQSPTSDEVIVLNTHWDDRGLEARTNSAKLIVELVREELRESEGNEELLVVLLGDLNSPAEEKGYQVLTGDRYKKERGEGVEGEKTFWDSRHEIATRKTSLAGPGALSSCVDSHSPTHSYSRMTGVRSNCRTAHMDLTTLSLVSPLQILPK